MVSLHHETVSRCKYGNRWDLRLHSVACGMLCAARCRRKIARPRGQFVFGLSGHFPHLHSNSSSGTGLNRVAAPLRVEEAAFFAVLMLPSAAAASDGKIRFSFIHPILTGNR